MIRHGSSSRTQFYPIPTQPEPLRPDGRLTDRERERLQIADALLVVGTDEDDLAIDMAVVGRHARSLSMAKTPKLLPVSSSTRSARLAPAIVCS